jgi:hypothetical protein
VSIFIHVFRRSGKGSVDLCDSAGRWGEQVRYRFHRLDCSERLTCREFCPHFRGFDKDDVAEGPLRIVGDADGRSVAIDLNPLVLFGVLAICGIGNKSFQLLAAS